MFHVLRSVVLFFVLINVLLCVHRLCKIGFRYVGCPAYFLHIGPGGCFLLLNRFFHRFSEHRIPLLFNESVLAYEHSHRFYSLTNKKRYDLCKRELTCGINGLVCAICQKKLSCIR